MKTPLGKIFFISGPSGVGKGTLINILREKYPQFLFPPSCTTRAPRPGEVEGQTYYFITKDEFLKRIEAGDFLEYAQVHGGNLYGTLKMPLTEGVENGNTVIREFDVQGFDAARKKLPRDYYVSIFLEPAESVDTLMERVRARAPISEEEITKRKHSMHKELAMKDIYDHRIVSVGGEIEKLVADAEAIIFAHVPRP